MARPLILSSEYRYIPLTDAHRAKLSAAHRARLGIPEGYSRVYGVHVPIAQVAVVRAYATDLARLKGYSAAHSFVVNAGNSGWFVPAERLTPEKILKSDPRYAYCPRSPRIIGKMFERIARLMLNVRRSRASGGGGGGSRYDWELVAELLAEGATLQDVLTFTGANESYLKTQLRKRGLYRSKRVVLNRDG